MRPDLSPAGPTWRRRASTSYDGGVGPPSGPPVGVGAGRSDRAPGALGVLPLGGGPARPPTLGLARTRAPVPGHPPGPSPAGLGAVLEAFADATCPRVDPAAPWPTPAARPQPDPSWPGRASGRPRQPGRPELGALGLRPARLQSSMPRRRGPRHRLERPAVGARPEAAGRRRGRRPHAVLAGQAVPAGRRPRRHPPPPHGRSIRHAGAASIGPAARSWLLPA